MKDMDEGLGEKGGKKRGSNPKIMCRYFPRALCLRDNQSRCEGCPYYRTYKEQPGDSKNI